MLQESPEDKKVIQTALKKASSHLATIETMVEDNAYCIDVIQQLKAVHGLIHSAMDKTLEIHLSSCFKKGMETAEERRKKELISEIIQVTKIANK